MTTIRQLINKLTEIKYNNLNAYALKHATTPWESIEQVLWMTGIVNRFLLNNGIEIFLDMPPPSKDFFAGHFKSGAYRKLDFYIYATHNFIPTKEIMKYATIYGDNYLYPRTRFFGVPERLVNEFLNLNSGIDIDMSIEKTHRSWAVLKELKTFA